MTIEVSSGSASAWLPARSMARMLAAGLRSRVTRPRERRDSTSRFFDRYHRLRPDLPRATPYTRQILRVLDHSAAMRVLDLGCGSGAVHAALSEAGIGLASYVGLDASVRSRVLAPGAEIIRTGIEAQLRPGLDFDTVTAVNLLCYCSDLGRVPALRGENGAARILVVEPCPSILWPRHFEGVVPTYRDPDDLFAAFRPLGWSPARLHLMRLAPFGIFSYAASFRRA